MEPGGTLSAVPSHDPGPGRDAARLAVRAFGLDETAHRRNGGGATIQILTGDCMDVLPTLPAQSVQCCVTSPPYWGLRDYGVDGALGLESTPEEYLAKMVAVFREVWRVLRDDGTLWVNMGDSYAQPGGHNQTTEELLDE